MLHVVQLQILFPECERRRYDSANSGKVSMPMHDVRHLAWRVGRKEAKKHRVYMHMHHAATKGCRDCIQQGDP